MTKLVGLPKILYATWKNHVFFRHLTILVGGNMAGQVVNFISYLIIAQLYVPAHLAYFSLYMTFVSSGAILATLRYEMAIPSASTEEEATQLAILSLAFALPISLLASIVFSLLISLDFLGYGELPGQAVYFSSPAIFAIALYYTLRYWHLRHNNIALLSKVSLRQSLARGFSQIMLGLLGSSWWGIILGETIGRYSGLWQMFNMARLHFRTSLGIYSLQEYKAIILKYRKFALFLVPSSLIASVSIGLPIILITSAYGAEVAGQFSLSAMIFGASTAVITLSLGDILHQRVAQYWQTDISHMISFMFNFLILLIVLASIFFGLTLLLGEFFIQTFFGSKWYFSSQIIWSVGILCFSQIVAIPFGRVLIIFNKSDVKLFYDFMSIILPFVAITLSQEYSFSAIEAANTLNIFNAFTYVVYLFLAWWVAFGEVRKKRT